MRLARAGAVAAALSIAVPPLASARAEPPPAASAATWVAGRQAADGGFFGASQPADATAEAVAALATVAAPAAQRAIGRALEHLRRAGPARASRPAYAGRIVMGLVAARQNPRAFGGVDYVARIEAGYNAAAGSYETGVYADALAILGLLAAGRPVPSNAVTYLRANQCSDGGFAHDPGCVPRAETDTTSMVLCALAGMGAPPGDLIVSRAREWLRAARVDGGGWPHFPGGRVNANSTGLAVSALECVGERDEASRRALQSLQTASGGIRYDAGGSDANEYATVQAIPALAGSGYPVRVAPATATQTAGSSTGSPASSPASSPGSAGSHRGSLSGASGSSGSDRGSPPGSLPGGTRPAEESDKSDKSDSSASRESSRAAAAGEAGPHPAALALGTAFAAAAAAFAGARIAAALRRRRTG
ncbi:MAG TPA: prenyltransferase/squalene oxidase repeat-containing protein [Actinomycetota bacterium]